MNLKRKTNTKKVGAAVVVSRAISAPKTVLTLITQKFLKKSMKITILNELVDIFQIFILLNDKPTHLA